MSSGCSPFTILIRVKLLARKLSNYSSLYPQPRALFSNLFPCLNGGSYNSEIRVFFWCSFLKKLTKYPLVQCLMCFGLGDVDAKVKLDSTAEGSCYIRFSIFVGEGDVPDACLYLVVA